MKLEKKNALHGTSEESPAPASAPKPRPAALPPLPPFPRPSTALPKAATLPRGAEGVAALVSPDGMSNPEEWRTVEKCGKIRRLGDGSGDTKQDVGCDLSNFAISSTRLLIWVKR